jgi:tetratricopeptide (TPR) repeat protein
MERSLSLAAELSRDFPDAADLAFRYAGVQVGIANMLEESGKTTEAETLYIDGIKRRAKICRQFPDVAQYQMSLGATRYNYANLLQNNGRHAEAVTEFDQAVSLITAVMARGADRQQCRYWLAQFLYNRAGSQYQLAQKLESEQSYRQSLDYWEGLAKEFPEKSEYESRVGATLNNIAMVIKGEGRSAEARDLLVRAESHQRRAIDVRPTYEFARTFLINHLDNLVDLHASLGEYQEASDAAARLVLVNEDESASLQIANLLSSCVSRIKRDPQLNDQQRAEWIRRYVAQAHSVLRAAINRLPENLVLYHQWAYFCANDRNLEMRDPKYAVVLAKAAVRSVDNNWMFWQTLGIAHYRNGQWSESMEAMNRSIAECPTTGTCGHFAFLAMAHWQLGQQDDARKWYDQAIAWTNDCSSPEEKRKALPLCTEAAELLNISPATDGDE